jgi:hypothetical protein
MTESIKMVQVSVTPTDHHSKLFASSAFDSNISTKITNDTVQKVIRRRKDLFLTFNLMFFLYLLKKLTSQGTISDKSIAIISATECRPATRVNRISQRSRLLEKQVCEKEKTTQSIVIQFVAGTKAVRKKRCKRVIHVSLFGTSKHYLSRNNKVSSSNNKRHSVGSSIL